MIQKKQRLSKFMAASGVASRRACEELIFAGRVKVNGAITLLPQSLVDDNDCIEVNGQQIHREETKVYFMLNKPRNYLCTTVGNEKSQLVLDLFKEVDVRLFTIGRLDKDTQGLLLVTNDGHFANRVIHPSSNIHKEYLAKTDCEITPVHLLAISNGTLVEGLYIRPISVEKVRRGTVKITVAEGKKHEVRLLLEAAGLKVMELTRIRIGGLVLGSLPLGSWRPISEKERTAIFG